MEERTVLGIDFNNLFYSSFYQPELIYNGMNVNAIRGFMFKLRMLKETLRPYRIVIAKDGERCKTLRRQLYPLYKAHRGTTPIDLIQQIPYVIDILSSLGYPILELDSYEGDDVLGMLSRFYNHNGYNFIIASSDKDFFQLIDDNTAVYNMREKMLYTIPEVMFRYNGLTPNQLIDLKALAGDSSDNIPGVVGIGEVIGIELIKRFDSLDGIYNNLDSIKLNIRSMLESGKHNAYLSYTLGKIITDYTLMDLNFEMLNGGERDLSKVYNLINQLGLSESLNILVRYNYEGDSPSRYSFKCNSIFQLKLPWRFHNHYFRYNNHIDPVNNSHLLLYF